MIKYGVLGSADISGIIRGGYRVEIEVKTGKASQSDQQKLFEKMINNFNGIYFVARSVDDAVKQLQIAASIRDRNST